MLNTLYAYIHTYICTYICTYLLYMYIRTCTYIHIVHTKRLLSLKNNTYMHFHCTYVYMYMYMYKYLELKIKFTKMNKSKTMYNKYMYCMYIQYTSDTRYV